MSDGIDAISSICPKGWKLPKGGVTSYSPVDFRQSAGMNDFAAAINYTGAVGGSNIWNDLFNPSFKNGSLTMNGITWAAAGRYDSSKPGAVGSSGYYWSRTSGHDTASYYFYFLDGNLSTAVNGYYKYRGLSVRCVAYSN